MNPILYDSDDLGAPVLRAGDPKSFLAVLKRCLVGTGGVAYGTKQAAGWTAPFEDVNNSKLALRQGGGQQRYLRLGEPEVLNAGASNGRRFIRVRGYDSMSDIDTGEEAFPRISDRALDSYYWAFSTGNNTSNGNTRIIPWTIIADDRFFYLLLFGGLRVDGDQYNATVTYFFGDFISYRPGDIFNTIIYANSSRNPYEEGTWLSPNVYHSNDKIEYFKPFCGHPVSETQPNLYIMRSFSQIGFSKECGLHSDHARTGQRFGFDGAGSFPDKITGGFNMSPVWAHEPRVIRGRMPGLWAPWSQRVFEHLDMIPGEGQYLGTDFVSLRTSTETRISIHDTYNVYVQLSDWRA